MKYAYGNGTASVIIRFRLNDSTTGLPKTGLTHASAGLVISTIADVEAAATAYSQAANTIETIATLGTYVAPTATKCRFREVDATNHAGLYELQLANGRFSVAGARSLIITISGVAATLQQDAELQLEGVTLTALALTSIRTKIEEAGSFLKEVRDGLLGRYPFLDKLNFAGAIATAADINALNQSASRRILGVVLPYWEIPESGTNTYSIELRLWEADGAAINATGTPSISVNGQVSGAFTGSLSVIANPETGVYRWTFPVGTAAVSQELQIDFSALLPDGTFNYRALTQMNNLVGDVLTSTDKANMAAAAANSGAIKAKTDLISIISGLVQVGDSAGVAALLTRLTLQRAAKLDSVALSSQISALYGGADAAMLAAVLLGAKSSVLFVARSDEPGRAANEASWSLLAGPVPTVGDYISLARHVYTSDGLAPFASGLIWRIAAVDTNDTFLTLTPVGHTTTVAAWAGTTDTYGGVVINKNAPSMLGTAFELVPSGNGKIRLDAASLALAPAGGEGGGGGGLSEADRKVLYRIAGGVGAYGGREERNTDGSITQVLYLPNNLELRKTTVPTSGVISEMGAEVPGENG